MLYPQNNSCRRSWKLDGYWQFRQDPQNIGRAEHWECGLKNSDVIAVPASWNEQKMDWYHYTGAAWYQRLESLPELTGNQRVMLRFSSVQYTAEVYVNGKLAGINPRPYLPFEFDVTDLVSSGENRITLRVDGQVDLEEPVCIGDFYGYAGIARPVFFTILDEKQIHDISVKTRLGKDSSTAEITAYADKGLTIISQIDGTSVQLEEKDGIYSGSLFIKDAIWWDCENPHLYTLKTELRQGDKKLDEYSLSIGFREIEVCGREIRLNGKKTYLTGFGKHEDFPVIGKGLCHALNIRDFDTMKWCGGNSFRTSHYPYSEEILDLADQQGFLVIDETPFIGLNGDKLGNEVTRAKALEYMKLLIDRDKNHPSVISWSIGNECDSDASQAEGFFLPVIELAKQLDSRPITYVAWTKPEEDKVYPHVDIVGMNRYYGWYPYENWPGSAKPGDLDTAMIQMEECLESFARLFSAPIIVTEFGADTIEGMHSPFLLQFTEEFQSEFLERYIKLIRSKPYTAGMHIWAFADFNTSQNPRRVMGNRKGLFTRIREPKMAAHTVRKLWTGKSGIGLTSLKEDPNTPDFHVPE